MAIDAPGILDQVNESAELNDIISGNLASTSDKDIYRIASSSVETDSLLIVDFGGYVTAKDNEFLISILDSSGTVLSTLETGQDEMLMQTVSAGGSYYISVEKGTGYDGRSYSITPTIISLTEDEINDEYTSASRLIADNTVSGILGTAAVPSATDEDWYYFTTGNASGATVDITITTTNAQQNYYDVTLYQSDGEQVVRNGSGEQQSKSVGIAEGSLGFTLSEAGGANEAGTYFVKVSAFDTDTFVDSDEAGIAYQISLSGTTDYNVYPVITSGGTVSGLAGTITTSANSQFFGVEARTKLEDILVVEDNNEGADNASISSYKIKLVDAAPSADGTSGYITFTNDDGGATATINGSLADGATFETLTSTEFASAYYYGGADGDAQTLSAYVVDGSGTSEAVPSLANPTDTSGLIVSALSTVSAVELATVAAVKLPDGSGILTEGGATRSFNVTSEGSAAGSLNLDSDGALDLSEYVDTTVQITSTITGGVSDLVDLLDVLKLLDHASGSELLTGTKFAAADMNSNGVVDLLDALAILGVISEETDATLSLVTAGYSPDIVVGSDDMDLYAIVSGDILEDFVTSDIL